MHCTIVAYIVEYLNCVSFSGGIGSGTRLVTVQVHLGVSVESDIHIYSHCVGCLCFCYSLSHCKSIIVRLKVGSLGAKVYALLASISYMDIFGQTQMLLYFPPFLPWRPLFAVTRSHVMQVQISSAISWVHHNLLLVIANYI